MQSDSVNVGGGNSTSTNYGLEDTVGEAGTGEGASASFNLHAGYQQMQEVYLAMTAPGNVVLSPSIGGTTGGQANGATSVTVTTDSPAGYELMIRASGAPALTSGGNSFADYAASAANPDFSWNVPAADSEFGYSPEGSDIAQGFKDDGAACNTGSSDTANSCWAGLTTSDVVIAERLSSNQPLGTATSIKFRAESGTSHVQPAGSYAATTTITAIAL
jgi:hypothetical protein